MQVLFFSSPATLDDEYKLIDFLFLSSVRNTKNGSSMHIEGHTHAAHHQPTTTTLRAIPNFFSFFRVRARVDDREPWLHTRQHKLLLLRSLSLWHTPPCIMPLQRLGESSSAFISRKITSVVINHQKNRKEKREEGEREREEIEKISVLPEVVVEHYPALISARYD